MDVLIQKQFDKHNLPRKLVLATDLAITSLALLTAYLLRFNLQIDKVSFVQVLVQQVCIILPIYLVAFLWSGSYRGIIRHSGIEDASRFAVAVSLATGAALLVSLVIRQLPVSQVWFIPFSVILIHAFLVSVMLMGYRLIIRSLYYTYGVSRKGYRAVLIFGAGDLGQITWRVLENDRISKATVVGFIDDNKNLVGKRLCGIQIYSERQAFEKLLAEEGINEIVFAVSRDKITSSRKKELFDRCLKNNVHVREVPPVKEWIDGQFSSQQIREINIEDLLGRDAIWLDQARVAEGLQQAVVLVTGAAGSIGSEIVRQLMSFNTRQVILLDQAESALYDLQNELAKNFPAASFEVVVASVTNAFRMRRVFETYRPHYVFNAAAYKHVPLMEANPAEAIRVNVGGTRLVADLSVEFGVKKFVMVSTDKAVNPTNVMGASKRICEIYIQALTQSHKIETQFITTRFGNVLGSNGSVVPLFRKQIAAGGPVTVTHPDIIRYFMTIPEACQLVLEAGFMGKGGEIYVFDMGEPVKIYDLAVKMISLSGFKVGEDISIRFTGLRPGEKLYEELLADEENTVATHHPKIKAARVRQHQYEVVDKAVGELIKAARCESDDELVCRMKALVPEFISQNSGFSQFDPTPPELLDLPKNIIRN